MRRGVFERIPAIAWRQKLRQAFAAIIELNPLNKFQKILGFGAAFTDASCYMFNQLSGDSRRRLFHELFHPSRDGTQRLSHLHRLE